jgi:hypothetical protein
LGSATRLKALRRAICGPAADNFELVINVKTANELGVTILQVPAQGDREYR